MAEYVSACGCKVHVAQWTSKRRIVSIKYCLRHSGKQPPTLAPVPASGGSPLVSEQRKDNGDKIDEITVLKNSLRERDETIRKLCWSLRNRSKCYHTTAGTHEGKWKDCPLCADDRALLDQAQGGVK